ncbi:hemagglutinin repeat-containing protein [Erwinia sp. MMLR14_017]|uniref:two-partner secretion domain-containing protein n=1 Tax=Erwinia sp. MMLR14_017 TaxID=3093842 RepID=UPI00298F761C|nr:hemagglutinin repeat-containing protein [Erwinia sp. MMLR14_017]MDW8847090.1 hemagglutinin repeat-containing protein [Erwinia sp. MMLR14_017]
MNRLLYRVVFNKVRGMLMVVADIARACSGGSPASGIGHNHLRLICRLTVVSFSLWLSTGAVQMAQATIVADKSAPGKQQPTIVASANGTPQVNIQSPSASGVSRNIYSRFDVDKNGAILNNARKNASTQLGGMVSANPWLAKGEAKIILNEVNARDPSRLNGYIEVAGQKAQVIIASPSGITCNGCGFINAGRAMLTTGTAQMQNGNLTGYLVDRGEVVVEGKGLDASRQDYTDIIARAVKVNAAIYAKDLRVTAGRNRVDAAHETTTAQVDDGSARPQLALDVSQVGGMYAGKIRLRATEKGVGVRNAGTIGSEAGLVTVTADGRIENSGELSSQDALQLSSASGITNSGKLLSQQGLGVNTSGNISNSGIVWSSTDATLAASGALQNSGLITASNNVTLSGSTLTSSSTGTLAAGKQPDGRIGSSGDLTLSASGQLKINGINLAGGTLRVAGQGVDASGSQTQAKNITLDARQGNLTTASAQVIVDGTLTATAAGTLDNAAGKIAADKLSLTASSLNNQQGQLIQSGTQSLTLNHQDGINNRGGKIATNAADITLKTASLDNRNGEIIHAGSGTLKVDAVTFQGDNGSMDSSGTLALSSENLVLDGTTTSANRIHIDAGNLSNRDGKLVQSGLDTMTLNVRKNTDNQGGLIAANGAVTLTTTNLANSGGQVLAAENGSLTVAASGQTDNHNGMLTANDGLTLTTGQLNNDKGQISVQQGAARVISTRQLSNVAGQITAAKDVQITATGLDSSQGQIAGDNLFLALGEMVLNNQNGVLAAQNVLTVSSGELNNSSGLMQSGAGMQIDTHGYAFSNHNTQDSGGIISFGDLNVTAGAVSNQNGMLAGAGATRVQATDVDNSRGMLASESGLQLNAQSLNNQRGALSSGLEMALTLAGMLDNSAGKISSRGNLNADVGQLENAQGVVVAGGDALLNVMQTINNRQGQLAAQGNFTLHTETLNNDGGLVQSGKAMTLTAGQISNQNSGDTGGIISQGDMQIDASALNNDNGVLIAGKQTVLDASTFSNIAGTLVALNTLRLSVQSDTDNRQGLIQGKGIVLDTRGHLLDNREGTVSSLAAMQLASGGVNNQSGTLGAKGDFSLQADRLDNGEGGRVVGESSAVLTLAQLLNNGGQIQIVGSLLVSAAQGVIDNTLGLIRSGATTTLAAASLINRDTLSAEKGIEGRDIIINSAELDNSTGSVLAGQDLSVINYGTLDNTGGELAAGNMLSLSGTVLELMNRAGVVKAGQQMTVQADRLGGDGQLLSLGDMTLSSHSDISNSGEMIANGSFSLTTPGAVTNGGKLLAGAKLDLTSGNLLNATTGEIAAGSTWLTMADTLTNQGLIDGSETRLVAGILTNSGTGRIYGDYLGIQAGTLNNLAEDGVAATIAGRERVDIGAGTVNNLDHALIYSGGELALGGALNENGIATGQAGVLNNHSSTIESAADMALSVGQLNNINDHFTTEVVQVSSEQITEYQHSGSSTRWSADEEGVFIDRNSADNLLNLNTPEDTGSNNDNFYQYDYTRTTEEEVIKKSDPGKILSGGNLSILADRVLNDKSQIVAGGTLGIVAQSVDNVMPEGSRRITDEGSVTHYSRKTHKGGDDQGESTSEYVPPVVIQSITLKPGRLESNSQPQGSGLKIAAAEPQGTDATTGVIGSVSAAVTGSDILPGLQNIDGAEVPATGDLTAGSVLRPGQQYEVPVSNGAMVVRVSGPDTRLPDASLFSTHPEPEAGYLVETDPRFTNNKQWLGSDYMQDAFSLSGDNLHKRLGDGYYEQRLVREQVITLTGGRYLTDYRDDEAQFKGLMDAGIAFGKEYNLIPGVALSAEQMSLLTEDMVWLVNSDVTLADGTRQTVMVPQVYARVKAGDIDGSGALLGGQSVVMNLNSDLLNSGTISGREAVQLTAENITNRAGTIQGTDVSMLARTDINNIAGVIAGNNSVLAAAGRDINIMSTIRSAQSSAGENHFARTTLDRVGGIYVQDEEGRLSLSAGRDITLSGGQVVNSGSQSQTMLNTGRDLSLNAVMTSASDSLTWDKDNWLKQSVTQYMGSEVTGAGSVLLAAGRDVKAQAATVSAGDGLGVKAGRDIGLTTATADSDFESHHKSTGGNGTFSKTTAITHDMVNRETAQGSALSGDSVTMQAGNNLLIQGSSVAGDNDVRLAAGNNLTITTADEHNEESHQRQEKKSGLSGTGGIGVTYGTQQLKVTDTAQDVTQQGSTVGSVDGSVSLSAGNTLTVKGSDLVAGQDMALSGKEVNILAAENQSTQTHKVEQKQSGLTLALSGAAGSALNTAVTQAKSAGDESDGRLAALKGIQAALNGVSATQAARLDGAKGNDAANNNTVGVSLSYGSQSSKSQSTLTEKTQQGSTLTAGNNLSIRATGSGVKGESGDITVQGSQLQAGRDMQLSANRDVNLVSAEESSSTRSSNSSRGGSVGVGLTAGSGGAGLNVSASVNKGKGHENADSVSHAETQVKAGNQVTITSGRDTLLAGAQVSGEKVIADVGRNLTLASEQDRETYDSKQQSTSAGAGYTFGAGTASASISASRDKMHSDWKSVTEQTGIFAGAGGFDVTVGGHTQLDGAVIGSTASADKNTLDTGTLGFSDIHNHAAYDVEHAGAGISTGGSIGDQFAGNMANGVLSGLNGSDNADSVTRAAVSAGTIVIRDPAKQTQDVAGLSRDVENANPGLDEIFDKEKEQNRLKAAQLIAEIGSQVGDIARAEGQIAGEKAKRDPAALQAAREQLAASGKPFTDADVAKQAYNNAMASFGTGSALQQGISAATAAIQGLAGGNIGQAISGAASPYLAEQIHVLTEGNPEAKAMAHAVVGAVASYASGNSALAGAAGAVSGELMAGLVMKQLYPGKEVSDLTETEKQTISALGTLAAGLAGGVTGDSTSDAVAGAQAGQNAVENNLLGGSEDAQAAWIRQHGIDMASCADAPGSASCQKAMNERDAVGLALATGSVALLPGGAQAMWGLGAGANAGIGYLADGTIDPANAAIAGWVNVISMGNGLAGTVGWNAAGGALGNWIDDKDPLSGALINGAGSGIGYGIGKGLSWGVNAGANWWKGGWDPKFNADLRQFKRNETKQCPKFNW